MSFSIQNLRLLIARQITQHSRFGSDELRETFNERVRQLNIPNSEDLWNPVRARFLNETRQILAQVYSDVILEQVNERKIRFYATRQMIPLVDLRTQGVQKITKEICIIAAQSADRFTDLLHWQMRAQIAPQIRQMLLDHQANLMVDAAPNVDPMIID